MAAVYAGMGVTDLDKTMYCYNHQDGWGGRQLRSLTDSNEIWDRPKDGGGSPFRSGLLSVSKAKLNMGCLVYVKPGSDATDLRSGLPKQDITDKAALVISCGGGSREAYFAMR
jgi:hypothetical protein